MAEIKDDLESDDIFVLKSDLQNNYVKKIDIYEDVHLSSCVMMTEIIKFPNDHVINSVLITILSSYATNSVLTTKLNSYATNTALNLQLMLITIGHQQ